MGFRQVRNCKANDLSIDNKGFCTIVGAYYDTITLSSNSLVSNGYLDLVVAKIGKNFSGVYIDESKTINPNQLITYPNPVQVILNVEIEIKNVHTELFIIDTYGRKVERVKLTANHNQIDMSDLSSGIYFVQVFENGRLKVTEKILKQ